MENFFVTKLGAIRSGKNTEMGKDFGTDDSIEKTRDF